MNEMQKCCYVSFKTVIYYVQLLESWFTCISMFFIVIVYLCKCEININMHGPQFVCSY